VFTSTWTLGVLAAIASWNVAFTAPGVGLDSSWDAALHMAVHRGMHFGNQTVFTYGPLEFLRYPRVWYGDLATLGFVYQSALHIVLCVSLIWALRRTLNAGLVLVLTVLVVVAAPTLDVPLTVAAVWCLAALSPEPPRFAASLVLFGGAALGAVETLIELRSGPVILAMCTITLLAHQHTRRRVPLFIGCAALGLAALWFGAGQGLENLPDFVKNGAQVVSGYSGAAVAFGRRRMLAIAAVGGLAALSIISFPPESSSSYSPVTRASRAGKEVGILFSAQRRQRLKSRGAEAMISSYGLGPATLRLLEGHSVNVDPWEAGVVWAYGLKWAPPPVFQNYTAYTRGLDRLNSDALRGPNGPERILRGNAVLDGRLQSWDPPGQSLAMLCNYVPLQTTTNWQVLGKVPDRCDKPRRINSIRTRFGATVTIPPAAAGGVLYAKVDGAGVAGLERLRTFLYRARFRYVVVDHATSYRLVPGTAGDGLIMDVAPDVDYAPPFFLSPLARTLKFTGSSGPLRLDLYWMRVAGRRAVAAGPTP
jgi:hypothetical protein